MAAATATGKLCLIALSIASALESKLCKDIYGDQERFQVVLSPIVLRQNMWLGSSARLKTSGRRALAGVAPLSFR